MPAYLPKVKKRNLAVLLLLGIIYLGNIMCVTLNNRRSAGTAPDFGAFAGSAACKSCHRQVSDSQVHTAHYFTSRPAEKAFIKGSFDSGKNRFVYNPWMEVALLQQEDGFYQRAFVNGAAYDSKRFDIVVGSGRKGQTYLYWEDDHLFQLPVSYYTPLDSWCNSPGYPTNYIRFNRPINAQCLECHGTYAQATILENNSTAFDKSKMVYGVDCERCHGPAAEHVNFHTAHPNEKTSRYIVNIRLLNRQQRLDACALCHSGARKEIRPAFSFVTGDTLNQFSEPGFTPGNIATLDVHGNQYGLLTSSKCFKMSAQMDCSSCHSVHANEFNSPQLFSTRCMSCHHTANQDTCTLKDRAGLVLAANCIDCHLPQLPSQKIVLQLSGNKISSPDVVRTHRVAIYPDQTKAYLKKMRKQ